MRLFELSAVEEGNLTRLRGACWLGEGDSNPFFASELLDEIKQYVVHPETGELDDGYAEQHQRVGLTLYERAFSGQLNGLLCSAIAGAGTRSLRIALNFHGNRTLQSIPWELLWSSNHNRHLALSPATSITRRINSFESIRPFRMHGPIKVLFCSTAPDDRDALDSEGELLAIKDKMTPLINAGRIEFVEVTDPTVAELESLISGGRFHVFHFSGHASSMQGSKARPHLVFSGRDRHAQIVSAPALATLLQPHRSIRLVVLNACETGAWAGGYPNNGLAQALLEQGVPAVVAMQRPITDIAAVLFATSFYESIAQMSPVDDCITSARRQLFFGKSTSSEWPIVSLYMRSKERFLFSSADAPPAVAANREHSARKSPAGLINNLLERTLLGGDLRKLERVQEELERARREGTLLSVEIDKLSAISQAVARFIWRTLDISQVRPPTEKAEFLPQTGAGDFWRDIAHACHLMGESSYLAAIDVLSRRSEPVPIYLRAICRYRAARKIRVPHARSLALRSAAKDFQELLDFPNYLESEDLRLLRLNAEYWMGIISFYLEDFDLAESRFQAALQMAKDAERARCFNCLAYVELAKGEFSQSERNLIHALEADPEFPIARSNFGYVLLTRGDYEAAQLIFERIVTDETLRIRSPRDVLLGRLALIHLIECKGKSEDDFIYQLYINIIAEVIAARLLPLTYSPLALSNAREIVSRVIYMNELYNGLEVFALALLSRAYLDLLRAGSQNKETTAQLARILELARFADCPIGWRFYDSSYGGWFQPIVELKTLLEGSRENQWMQ